MDTALRFPCTRKITKVLTRQLDILVFNPHKVPILAKLRQVEVCHSLSELSKSDEFFAVDACRVGENTAAIDDRNGLIRT